MIRRTQRLNSPQIRAGHGVHVAPDARLELWPGGELVLGDGCRIGPQARIVANGGRVQIGAGAVLGRRCTIIAHGEVVVGERARLAEGVLVLDFDHDIADVEAPIRRQGLLVSPVRIGADARLDLHACVLRGVEVGAGASVGPHALVTRDVAPAERVEGIPARSGPHQA